MAEQRDGEAVVVGGRYRVQRNRPCAGFSGLDACAVEHVSGAATFDAGNRAPPPSLVAIRLRREAPPPANLASFLHAYSPGLLMPVAHAVGGGEHWMVCDAPPGPSLLDQPPPGPLGEGELVNAVLKPLAQALARLHALGLTHRGVRPGNLFGAEGGRILLGPGCLGPPGYDQPALYEPVGSGLCPPWCRGPGIAADDVYALGVVLLQLVLGRRPLGEMPDGQIVQRKLEIGSYALLTAEERVPPALVSLLRSMLSDDPQARPSLSGLAEQGLGAERPKPARPDGRAPRPLMLGRTPVFTARMLAQGFGRQPAESLALLRAGTVDQWLRRALEQPALAARIEEIVRGARDRVGETGDPMLLMQVIALLDPLAPLFWNGTWLWPDGVPSLLAHLLALDMDLSSAGELLQQRVLRRWAMLSGRPVPLLAAETERLGALANGLPIAESRLPSLGYALNPFLRCMSPALGTDCVVAPAQLLQALETCAAATPAGSGRLLDAQMTALLAVRADRTGNANGGGRDGPLLDLALLAHAQARSGPAAPLPAAGGPVAGSGEAGAATTPPGHPNLASVLLGPARDRLKTWPGKGRRARRIERLERAAASGDLAAMLALVEQQGERLADEQALRMARAEVEALRGRHRASLDDGDARMRAARAEAQELAVVGGGLALAASVLAMVLP